MTECLCDLAAQPVTLAIGDKVYPLRKLRIADFAAAQEYIRDMGINAVLRATPMLLADGVRSAALADVACRPVTLGDVLADIRGQAYLISAALHDKLPQATPDWVMKLDGMTRKVLDDVLFYVCGLPRPEPEVERPLALSAEQPSG